MAKSKNNKERRRRARLAIRPPAKTPADATFSQEKRHGSLLVTAELEKALEECKQRVSEIATDCRRRNRKFRDIEFDLELDSARCLHGLGDSFSDDLNPSDVQRVTKIFDKPSFFIDGADSNDIIQGMLGDCWFLSALATMSTSKGLVEKFCVAYDELVGVYGFIFFRDNAWVNVIIDDLLYTKIPKFEELTAAERQLYHDNKENFNKSARKGGNTLYFSKSGTDGETWVPLIEKAYAKLHGNYASLGGGEAGEAIEDLTGGVTSFIFTKDILDPDVFWNEELCHANDGRLFGCAFNNLDGSRRGDFSGDLRVNGLIGGHAYSILRAVEYKDKRFLVIRNPWGQSEWTGPWSDGSKEWTPEWLEALPVLGHKFGEDGEFVMEYNDFLENWEQIDRTLLFDASWVMSSQWLQVVPRPLPSAWSYGDVSFTISLSEATKTVIVLSKLDDRYWRDISDQDVWSFDFLLYKKGESKAITSSSSSIPCSRSVNAEVFLEAGEYVVHVRLDCHADSGPDEEQAVIEDQSESDSGAVTQLRALVRILAEQSKSHSIVSNIDPEHRKHLPIPLESLAGRDLAELALEAREKEDLAGLLSAMTLEPTAGKDAVPNGEVKEKEAEDEDDKDDKEKTDDTEPEKKEAEGAAKDGKGEDETAENSEKMSSVVYLGLRVYTDKAAPAKIDGQLRQTPLVGLAATLGQSRGSA